MAELPIAPGQVYIEVEYDYEYKSKDRLITIRQGECYMLVKKTNEDWWQVRKEEGTKAFYVPAQYVREVRKALMPPPKPIHTHPPTASTGIPQTGGSLWIKPTSLDLGGHERNADHLQRHESSYRRSPSAQTASSGHFSPPIHRRDSNHRHSPGAFSDHDRALAEILVQGADLHKGNSLPRTRARSPELVRMPLDVDGAQPCDSAGEERRTNDSESGDELSSSSTEHLQVREHGRSESPVYTNLQELKITQAHLPPLPSGSPLHTVGDWETYKDQNGRHYYYNPYTQERTWKPPRTRDSSTGNSRGDGHSAGDSSEWLKHTDEQGRPYYYSADGSRSEWELPKYNHSPPQPSGEGPKCRSLDRRQVEPIVLTKWRHSAYVQEPSEKPSEKCGVLNMTKITENGKKVRKNWTSSWTVLHGSTLLFAKGQGGGTSWFGGGQSKPELTVDVKGGSVEWASKDKSSKKHVIELKTRQGTELLIQSENEGVITEWFRALQDTISTHAWESDEAIEEDMPESPGAEKDKEHRDSKKGRAMKTSSSMDGSDNKKTRHKLKKFLTRRPTLQAVRDKGYIKGTCGGGLTPYCLHLFTIIYTGWGSKMYNILRQGLKDSCIQQITHSLTVRYDYDISICLGSKQLT
uniref:Rho GTPase activating protein 12a n=1 Tax=Sphaeramia orbicularis TaxID=375764 RepID=A0A673A926_9TELE